MCINGYLKSKLLSVIEMYEHIVHGETYDTRYGGRMIEQWSEDFITKSLKTALPATTLMICCPRLISPSSFI